MNQDTLSKFQEALRTDGLKKLLIVSDFDATITSFKGPSSWSIVDSYDGFSEVLPNCSECSEG